MKQAEIAAHSSGCNGGESRVFEAPLIGVLQAMASAIVLNAMVPGVFSLTPLSIQREIANFTTR